jgi:hypothetical protein
MKKNENSDEKTQTQTSPERNTKKPSTGTEKYSNLRTNGIFRNRHNGRKKQKGETFTLPSQTVPNQALSLKELLYKFSRGGEILSNGNEAYYGDDLPIDELSKMDKFERMEYQRELQGNILEMTQSLNALNADDPSGSGAGTAPSSGTDRPTSASAVHSSNNQTTNLENIQQQTTPPQ